MNLSGEAFFEAEAYGVLAVGAEGGDGVEAGALVEGDGFVLVDAGFETEERDAAVDGVVGEVGEEAFGEALAAEGGADVHAFEFGVVGADVEEAGAGGGRVVDSSDEEGHAFVEELFDGVAVAALLGVEGREEGVELGDEGRGGGGVGAFFGDGRGGHGGGGQEDPSSIAERPVEIWDRGVRLSREV